MKPKELVTKIKDRIYCGFKDFIKFVIHTINLFMPQKYDVIILRMDHLGDLIIWFDCARAIREHYAGQKIALVTAHCNVQLAKQSGYFDEVIDLHKNRFRKLVGLKSRVLIAPTVGQWGGFAKAICAKERITPESVHGDKKEKRYARYFNRIIPMPSDIQPEFITDEIVCRAIVGNDYQIKLADLTHVTKKYGDYHGYFAVSLGSQWVRKNWPVERFAQVAQIIYDTYHMPCCLVGTNADRPMADTFLQFYHGECVDLIGKTSLPELFSVLSDVEFIICNDTGNMHIAIACRTKCFCIPVGSSYPRFIVYPERLIDNPKLQPVFVGADFECWGCRNRFDNVQKRPNCINDVLTQPFDCVLAVSADDVWNRINSWLAQNR